jgi:hypothetical protein
LFLAKTDRENLSVFYLCVVEIIIFSFIKRLGMGKLFVELFLRRKRKKGLDPFFFFVQYP